VIVVSDASPLIALSAVARLDLLRELFGTVLIPEAVYVEIVQSGAGLPGAKEVDEAEWITPRTVGNTGLVKVLGLDLDPGESEAIVLALETGADLLLMDERKARRTATRLGLKVAGTLGLLVLAKQEGLLQEIRPVLDALVKQAGLRIGTGVYQQTLRLAGE
jgi:predicted nucleic acid-binding protein